MSTSFFDDDGDVGDDDTQLLPAAGGPAPRGDTNDDDDEFQLPPRLRGAGPIAGAGEYNARAGPSSRRAPAPAPVRHVREASTASRIDMDLDIDVDDLVEDIIAPDERTRRKGKARDSLLLEDGRESEVDRLMRRWMDERMAPELLTCDEELMGSLMERLEAQTEAASLLSSSSAGQQHDAKGKSSSQKSPAELEEEHERILLVQMEIERVRYALRSYIRARTYKVEKFAQYLLRTPGAKQRMTDVEYGYAQRYQALVEKHFTQAVTQNLPERLGRLDEPEMIVKPDLDQAVFACARRDCPPVRLPDGQMLEMRKGEIHMLRYRSVRRLLRDGDVKLV